MLAIITIGISASGKSTFAQKWIAAGWRTENRHEINRDNIRRQLVEQDGKTFSWDKWKWKREDEVTTIMWETIKDCALKGHDIIISDTNLNNKRRNAMIDELKFLGYEVEVKEFEVPLETAWKRDAARKDGVGHSVIANQYNQWLEYKQSVGYGRRKYVADPKKPRCILVDIDGTLAHMNGKRGAFEWDKVGVDDVDEQVRFMVNMVAKQSGRSTTEVIVLSGRDGSCEYKTCTWLKDNHVNYGSIFMRKAGDMRKDTIIKEEIFWDKIAPNYNVQFVIDDRPSVCRMWREVGLKVFQVGDVHVEF